MPLYITSFFKAAVWLFVCSLVGLLQILITVIITADHKTQGFDIYGFVLDGIFLFFSISIMISIVYDFFMDSEVPKSDFWSNGARYRNLGLIIVLIIVPLIAMVLYTDVYLNKSYHDTNFDIGSLYTYEKIILGVALVYTLLIKWVMYYHNEIKTLSNGVGDI